MTYLRVLIKTELLSKKEKRQLLVNLFSQHSENRSKQILETVPSAFQSEGPQMRDFIDSSCCWANTEQGHRYWDDISQRTLREELITEEAENL